MGDGERGFEAVEDFDLSPKVLACAIRLPAQRVNDVLAGRRQITPDMGLRFGPK
jgi:plasmid maintenance system antidote protein VapI